MVRARLPKVNLGVYQVPMSLFLVVAGTVQQIVLPLEVDSRVSSGCEPPAIIK